MARRGRRGPGGEKAVGGEESGRSAGERGGARRPRS